MSGDGFFDRGWAVIPPDAAMAAWAAPAAAAARRLMAAPGAEYRCDGTWFPGVNILPNEASGAAPAEGVPPLSGGAVDWIAAHLGFSGVAWDRAQISICLPGYPRHGSEETDAAHRFRRTRDAAHVDGLLREPPSRNRRLGETHGFILGLPLFGVADPGASSMVVWEGSHEIMRAAFRRAYAGIAPQDWAAVDVTEIYQEARRRCFETCRRTPVTAPVGGAYVAHRLALHGVAPWTAGAGAGAGARAIAYFRPDPFPGQDPSWWLDRP